MCGLLEAVICLTFGLLTTPLSTFLVSTPLVERECRNMGIEEDRCDLRDGLLLSDCLRMVRGFHEQGLSQDHVMIQAGRLELCAK